VLKSVEDTPITANTILKWGGAVSAVVGTIVMAVWFVAGVKGDVHDQKQMVETNSREQHVRDDQQDARIAKTEQRIDAQGTAVTDLQRKLDTAITILNRIDAKVDRP